MTDGQKLQKIGMWIVLRGVVLALAISLIRIAAHLIDMLLPQLSRIF